MAKICSAYFSGSGSWVAPAGVTRVFILAQGGAAGGSGGRNATSDTSYPGAGTTPYMRACDVVPNTSYSVTIGGGGTGGAPRTASAQNGGVGGNTTFGALLTFNGAPLPATPGVAANNLIGIVVQGATNTALGGKNVTSGWVSQNTQAGTTVSSYSGGSQGAPGWVGSAGGNGGNGSATTGSNGSNGTGIGAGGGSGGGGATSGGSGGNGTGGQLWVIWVE